jgi:hypothetical protein
LRPSRGLPLHQQMAVGHEELPAAVPHDDRHPHPPARVPLGERLMDRL